MLALLDGRELAEAVEQAATLLATVLGQDLETGPGQGVPDRPAGRRDRVISTVDPDARHGHKTSARGFDGYKGHTALDPDSEIITATTVTPGNAGDASVAEDLVADLLGEQPEPSNPSRQRPNEPDREPEPVEPSAGAAQDAERACVYGDYADPGVMPTPVRTGCSAGVHGRMMSA